MFMKNNHLNNLSAQLATGASGWENGHILTHGTGGSGCPPRVEMNSLAVVNY